MIFNGKTWEHENKVRFTVFEGLVLRALSRDTLYMFVEIKVRIEGKYYLWLYPIFFKINQNNCHIT